MIPVKLPQCGWKLVPDGAVIQTICGKNYRIERVASRGAAPDCEESWPWFRLFVSGRETARRPGGVWVFKSALQRIFERISRANQGR